MILLPVPLKCWDCKQVVLTSQGHLEKGKKKKHLQVRKSYDLLSPVHRGCLHASTSYPHNLWLLRELRGSRASIPYLSFTRNIFIYVSTMTQRHMPMNQTQERVCRLAPPEELSRTQPWKQRTHIKLWEGHVSENREGYTPDSGSRQRTH